MQSKAFSSLLILENERQPTLFLKFTYSLSLSLSLSLHRSIFLTLLTILTFFLLRVLPNDLKEPYPIPVYAINNQTGLKFHHLLSLVSQHI